MGFDKAILLGWKDYVRKYQQKFIKEKSPIADETLCG